MMRLPEGCRYSREQVGRVAFEKGINTVAQDDLFGAPAGWYPDPLGLPQLRWWNNHAWTEQTSAARQPMVMQDTKFAWADDELPTRREERERERQAAERGPAKPAQPTAATLRELEPPRAFTKVDDSPTPEQPRTGAFGARPFDGESFDTGSFDAQSSDGQSFDAQSFDRQAFDAQSFNGQAFDAQAADAPSFGGGSPEGPDEARRAAPQTPPVPSFDSLFDGTPSTPHEQPQYETRRSASRAADRDRRATPAATPSAAPLASAAPLVSTAPAWIIAMIPLFQLVLSLLLLTALGMGSNSMVFIAILTAPYLVVIALAFADFRLLKRQGVERPAHWTWALLTAPAYLLARARNVIRESGHGIGPVLVWFGLGGLHLASVVAIPGLLIVLLPAMFTSQLEASVEGDALLISGASMSVTCPVTPPVIFGEQTVCSAISSSGKNSEVAVSLERANGWIEWQVLDWGVWDMAG
jgi:hypothetical protein